MFAIWVVCIMPETFTGLAISCRCECTHPAVIRPSTEVGWADSSRWTRTWSGSSPSDSFEHHPSEVGVETVESVIVSVNNPIAICLNLNAKQKKNYLEKVMYDNTRTTLTHYFVYLWMESREWFVGCEHFCFISSICICKDCFVVDIIWVIVI